MFEHGQRGQRGQGDTDSVLGYCRFAARLRPVLGRVAVAAKGTWVSRNVAPREKAQTVVPSVSPATRSHSGSVPLDGLGSQLPCEKSPLTWMVAAQSPVAETSPRGSWTSL